MRTRLPRTSRRVSLLPEPELGQSEMLYPVSPASCFAVQKQFAEELGVNAGLERARLQPRASLRQFFDPRNLILLSLLSTDLRPPSHRETTQTSA